jgi:hypothetical protein
MQCLTNGLIWRDKPKALACLMSEADTHQYIHDICCPFLWDMILRVIIIVFVVSQPDQRLVL